MLLSKKASKLLNELLRTQGGIDTLVAIYFEENKFDNDKISNLYNQYNQVCNQLKVNFGIDNVLYMKGNSGIPY